MSHVPHMVKQRIECGRREMVTQLGREGEHIVDFMTQGLVRRASEIDGTFRDLDLGFVDAALMAYAERHDLPVLTFDFEDFRAAAPESGYWRLVVDEERYQEAVR